MVVKAMHVLLKLMVLNNGILHFRNVLQCVWTATWIRGIPSQKHTVAGYSESTVVDHIISI